MAKPTILILGAGPAGLGAAYQLRRQDRAHVTVLEQRDGVGGNAGSFDMGGQRLDYGSHRLHPACDPDILHDIKTLLGDDLLDRPRHGRIRLRGRWIHFPLKPLDLLLRLDRQFAFGATRDMVTRSLARPQLSGASFASVLEARLGPTICRDFYFPYARKIWGREPDTLAGVQAQRRVSANSYAKLLHKVLSQIPGLKRNGKGRFYYPRRGYGQISEAYAEAACAAGAELVLGCHVTRLAQPDSEDRPWTISAEQDGTSRTFHADHVWSTIPVSLLARLIEPAAPPEVLVAAAALEYRAMLLIYLKLPIQQFTAYDAHYFPDADISMTRLSEPKNYAAATQPTGYTTLCAELPCSPDDAYWQMSEADLGRRVADDLTVAGIPLPISPTHVHVKRLRQAYPIYAHDYEQYFKGLDAWVEQVPRLLSYGRQGLFAHDNTHHALSMAYAAVSCLQDSTFDHTKWQGYRAVFETHVVED